MRIEYEGVIEQQPSYQHVGYMSAANMRIINGESHFDAAVVSGLAVLVLALSLVTMRLLRRGSCRMAIIPGVLATVTLATGIVLACQPLRPASYESATPNAATWSRIVYLTSDVDRHRDEHGELPSRLPREDQSTETVFRFGLRDENRDGWGREFRYTVSPSLPDGFEIRSAGLDGAFDTADDITNGMTGVNWWRMDENRSALSTRN